MTYAAVGRIAYGQLSHRHGHGTTYVTGETGGLFATITWVGFGALSVIANGITSVRLVKHCSAWYARRVEEHPEAAEAVPATMSRLRRQPVSVELDADGS